MSKIYGLVLMVVFCILSVAASVSGEPTYDLHGDLIYPGAEEYTGVIDGFEALGEREDIIVINDSIYEIRTDAIFRNRAGSKTGLSSFESGMIVKFFALDNLLTKMWDTGEDEEDTGVGEMDSSTQEPSGSGQIRQEDGVWTN